MGFLSQPVTIQSFFRKDRKFSTFTVDVILSESTTDTLVITKQPVQQGASITDHAFKEPTVLSMQILFSDRLTISLKELYQQLLDLQVSRVPFEVFTPKRSYNNMLIASLGLTTDKATENCLAINITFQQIIIVNVTNVQVEREFQSNPQATEATQNAGKKQVQTSGLRTTADFLLGR